MEQPPEQIRRIMALLPRDVQKQFLELIQNCMRLRGYGMEYAMDYGRMLDSARTFLKTYASHNEEASFDRVCAALDIDPATARRKISRARCWDQIKEYRDNEDPSVRMPELKSHVDAIISAAGTIEEYGPLWVQYYKATTADQILITSAHIKAWVENYKALPVQSETVALPSLEDDEIPIAGMVPAGAPEFITVDVPTGNADAPAGSAELIKASGEGPEFKHPPEVLHAIERIVKIVSPIDSTKQAEWRRILSDPLKIKFEQLLEWAGQDEKTISRIALLIHGDFGKGLKQAIRIVKDVVDSHTRLSHLENLCLAEGGRWEHVDGSFRIIITKLKDSL